MAEEEYRARYRGVYGTARMLAKSFKRKITGGSGMAQEAGRKISGRQRQIDDEVEEAQTGRRRR